MTDFHRLGLRSQYLTSSRLKLQRVILGPRVVRGGSSEGVSAGCRFSGVYESRWCTWVGVGWIRGGCGVNNSGCKVTPAAPVEI